MKAQRCDFREQHEAEILNAGREIENFQAERFSRPLGVKSQRLEEWVMPVDQHSVVVLVLQQRFDSLIEIAEQRRQVARSFDFEEARQAIAMAVDVAALVLQFFIAVRGIEFVLLLDNHFVDLS